MEAASTSETLVNFYQTTRRYNPEDSHLHTRRHKNLKSHLMKNLILDDCHIGNKLRKYNLEKKFISTKYFGVFFINVCEEETRNSENLRRLIITLFSDKFSDKFSDNFL
jgi:hypothetical protein